MKSDEELKKIIEDKLHTIFKDSSLIFDKSRFAGGMTNTNYIMSIHGTDYVIRQPGFMTGEMINRQIEGINNSIASELGINSDCVFFDPETGIKISVYISNSTNIALADPNGTDNIAEICKLLKTIHNSSQPFPNRFDWYAELTKYEEIIEQLQGELFSDYEPLKKLLLHFMEGQITETTLVPCHNDTVPENFITSENGRAYLIDWEYSGMNDPAFDVAAYILESQLTAKSIEHLLHCYYQSGITAAAVKKIQCYMMAQDLLWTAWALIRHYGGDDYLDYCSLRYERFRRNITALTQNTTYSIAEMVKRAD